MLEAYSTGQTVQTNGIIPFTSVSLDTCCKETLVGTSTIQLTKSGVYELTFEFEGTPSTAGIVEVQMQKSGVVQPQVSIILDPTVATAAVSGSRNTFISVAENACKCGCILPVTIQFVNAGVGLVSANFHVTVKKV